MPSLKHLQFSILINAPAATVWHHMTDPESYRRWTSAFTEGSHFEGSWEQGAKIRFLSPTGEGMVAEIAESRRHEFISIRQLGFIANGVEDTTSDAVRAWAPAYENYTLIAEPGGTRLKIDQDMTAEHEAYMNEVWPKALALLKQLCEAPAAA